MPFNQHVSFPCEFTLRSIPEWPPIIFVNQSAKLRCFTGARTPWTNRMLKADEILPLEPSGRFVSHQSRSQHSGRSQADIQHPRRPGHSLTARTIESGTSPASVEDHIKTVEILVDRTSIETFVNHGEISATRFVLPAENGLSIKAEGGSVTVQSLTVYQLNSVWKDGIGD